MELNSKLHICSSARMNQIALEAVFLSSLDPLFIPKHIQRISPTVDVVDV